MTKNINVYNSYKSTGIISNNIMDIPYNNSHVFYTPRDNTEKIQIEVYQGERKLAIENEFLGKAIINLPKKTKRL